MRTKTINGIVITTLLDKGCSLTNGVVDTSLFRRPCHGGVIPRLRIVRGRTPHLKTFKITLDNTKPTILYLTRPRNTPTITRKLRQVFPRVRVLSLGVSRMNIAILGGDLTRLRVNRAMWVGGTVSYQRHFLWNGVGVLILLQLRRMLLLGRHTRCQLLAWSLGLNDYHVRRRNTVWQYRLRRPPVRDPHRHRRKVNTVCLVLPRLIRS